MTHLSSNWKKYLAIGVAVVAAGAAKLGYIPQPVADFVTGLFGSW